MKFKIFIIPFLITIIASCDDKEKTFLSKENKVCYYCIDKFKACNTTNFNETQICFREKIDSVNNVNENYILKIKNHLRKKSLTSDSIYYKNLKIIFDNQLNTFNNFERNELKFYDVKYNYSALSTAYKTDIIITNLCLLNGKLIDISKSLGIDEKY